MTWLKSWSVSEVLGANDLNNNFDKVQAWLLTLTNKDADNAAAGSVVTADLANDKSFIGTSVPNHLGVIGVTVEAINTNATGQVANSSLTATLVTGNVARGEWLVSSSTKWRAKTAGYDKPLFGAIGYAMTAYSGGGNGSVDAVIMPDPKQLSSAGFGWALGGYNSAATSNGQKFTVASATWSTVASAATSANQVGATGFGYGTTAGYSIGGGTNNVGTGPSVTAYKMPFATETSATVTSANLPAAKTQNRSGYNAADRGYMAGGYNAGYHTSSSKLTFATDTMSAHLGSTLSQARYANIGISNGTYCYSQAGGNASPSGVSDKMTVATDTWADNDSGDVTAVLHYTGISFAADNGYMAVKETTAYSFKLVLNTGISSSVSSTLPANQRFAAGVCDGSGLAWFSGDSVSPYSVSHKLTKASETFAADAGAVMSVGKHWSAYFNNGAY